MCQWKIMASILSLAAIRSTSLICLEVFIIIPGHSCYMQVEHINCTHHLATFHVILAKTSTLRMNLAYALNVTPEKIVHILVVHGLCTSVHNLANPSSTAVRLAVTVI